MYENKWKKYGNEYHSSAVTFDTVELEHVPLYTILKKVALYAVYKFSKEENSYVGIGYSPLLKGAKGIADTNYDKIPKIETDEETGMRYGSYSK